MQEQRLWRDTEWGLGEERNWAAEVGRGRQAGEGPLGSCLRSPAKNQTIKKLEGSSRGKKERKEMRREGGRGQNSPSTPIAWQGDVSNTWLVLSE